MKVITMNTAYTTTHRQTHPVNAEFGHASAMSALIQRALYASFGTVCHSINRAALIKKLMCIIKTDTTNAWGERTLAAGDMSRLEGCELGKRKPTHLVTYLQPKGIINPATGYCNISIPGFTPAEVCRTQRNVSHLRLFACAISIDPGTMEFETRLTSSDYLSLSEEQEDIDLPTALPCKEHQPILLFFGVGLYFNVNGHYYLSLTNGGISIKCLKAVKASAKSPSPFHPTISIAR